jgi:hypothetical protein
MAITREKLELLITGDARDAVMAMRQAAGAAGGLDDSVAASATKMSRLGAAAGAASDHIRENIGAYSIAAVAGLTAAAVASIREFTTLADKVRDFSRFAGVSAETSSRLVAVFDDLEVSQEAANTAFFRLNRGISSGTTNLEQYGAEVVRSKDGNLDIYRTLLSVADAYQSTSDSGRRAELVQEAFGRGGAALIPILEQGRDRIKELYGNVPEGQILNDAEVLRARQFELAMDDLNDSMMELKVAAGNELVPTLTTLATAMAGVIRATGEFESRFPRVASVIGDVKDAVVGAVNPLAGVTDALQDLGIGGGDATDKLTEATTRYNEAQKTFNALAADKKLKTDEGREATRQLRNAQDDLERVTNRVNVAHEEEITKLEQVKQSTYDVVLQKMGLEGAQIAVERATAAYNKTMGDSEATDLAKREATLSATTAIMAMAQKQLELEGQTTETEAGQKRLNEILTYIAGTLDPASPLRARLQDYANDLRGIPTDVVTSFRVRLDTNEIYNQLQDLGLSGEQAAEMIRQSYQYLLPGLAAGGVVTGPTVAMIGEAGPEAVIPLSQLPSMVPQTGVGSMSITVPLVVDGRVLAEVTASELNRPGGPVIKQRAIV